MIGQIELDRQTLGDNTAGVELAPLAARNALNVLGLLGLLIVVGGFALFIHAHFAPAIHEPDDNGYFAQGTLLSHTGKTWFVPESDAQYIGMHWLLTPDGHYISRYPPGIAVAIAVVDQLFGYRAAVYLNPAMGVLTLVGLYLIVRRWIGPLWGAAAAALMLINPTFTHHALSGDSHMSVAAVLVWGIFFLQKWSGEKKRWQIALAGLILGCIPSIRYPDAIMGLPAALFVLLKLKDTPNARKHLIFAAIGAGIPIVALLIRNQLVLGAFWRTGYALTNEQTGFSVEYFTQHFVQYIRAVTSDGLGVFFGLGLLGMTWMIFQKRTRLVGLMLALMVLPMLGVYMAYYWAPQGMTAGTLRFLLPTFPLYLLSSVWVLSQATQRAPVAVKIALPLVLIGLQIAWGTQEIFGFASHQAYSKRVLASVTDELEIVAPRGSIVLAQNNLLQHLDFVRQWKLADEGNMRGRGPGMGGPAGPGAAPRAGFAGPIGPGGGPEGPREGNMAERPSPMQQSKVAQIRQRYSGTIDERESQFLDDLLKWTDGKKVYVIAIERQLRDGVAGMAHREDLKVVARIALPEAPQMQNRREGQRRPGGFPGGANNPRQRPNAQRGEGPLAGPPGAAPIGGPGGGPGAPGGPGGGGPFGLNLAGEKELIIAEWTIR